MSTNPNLQDNENNNQDPDMDDVSALTQELSNKFSEVQDRIAHYAKENPIKTIGFSLLAGVIIAQLLRSKK